MTVTILSLFDGMAAVLVPKQAYTQSRWNIKAKSRHWEWVDG